MRGRVLCAVIVALLCFAGAGCGTSGGPAERSRVNVGSDFTVEPGQETVVADRGVTIVFDSVLDDSRCPPDKVCVWEGDATVRVMVRTDGEPIPITLHSSPRFATCADAAGLRICLIALNIAADRLTLRANPH